MKNIGILGAGQLARMLALAGLPLEMRFGFYDTTGNPSVGLDPVLIDVDAIPSNPALQTFIEASDLVTYEFEHLPLPVLKYIEEKVTIYPPVRSIEICQDRAKEKALFTELAIPTPAYRIVESEAALVTAVAELGTPLVSKTTTDGYDGKGQFIIKNPDQAKEAWQAIGGRPLIVEAFVNFSRELSVIAARASTGEVKIYPLAENEHHEGILRYSTAPAPHIAEETERQAKLYIQELIESLGHVGILTLELFETPNGLLANEMAPRVHNSGHWSIEGAHVSQFENHLRAISGLPLGDTQATRPTCMLNIIGNKGDINAIMALPYAHIHLYDKEERPGRKLGHVNVQADSYEELVWRVNNVAAYLPGAGNYQLKS
jgi:5-(carboxyamino)imidazole ribonucleotide synthase